MTTYHDFLAMSQRERDEVCAKVEGPGICGFEFEILTGPLPPGEKPLYKTPAYMDGEYLTVHGQRLIAKAVEKDGKAYGMRLFSTTGAEISSRVETMVTALATAPPLARLYAAVRTLEEE